MKICAIIPAAGKGERLCSQTPKAFVPIFGKPLLIHTLETLKCCYPFYKIVIAVSAEYQTSTERLLKKYSISKAEVVVGGDTRARSVKNAFMRATDSDLALIHDAARPQIDKATVLRTIQAAKKTGASLCVFPVTSTVKHVDSRGFVTATANRDSLMLAQTPQVFKSSLLADRYKALGSGIDHFTDEAGFFDKTKVRVAAVLGSASNIKLTHPEDIEQFKYYLRHVVGKNGGRGRQ